LKAANPASRVCQGLSTGSSSTPLPKCYSATSLPLKR
jgi:hypothetical protein